jgi:hypothetical protein
MHLGWVPDYLAHRCCVPPCSLQKKAPASQAKRKRDDADLDTEPAPAKGASAVADDDIVLSEEAIQQLLDEADNVEVCVSLLPSRREWRLR